MDKVELKCTHPKCAEKETVPHTWFGEKGEYNEIYILQCEGCDSKTEMPRKQWLFETAFKNAEGRKKAYLDKWPRVDPYTGEVVKSREHQEETLKRYGYHKAPHGIDHRYDQADSKFKRDISWDD